MFPTSPIVPALFFSGKGALTSLRNVLDRAGLTGSTFVKDYTQNAFVNADYGSGDRTGTFTRSTTATYIDGNGVVRTALANVARFVGGYYDATGFHAHTGLLMEQVVTNRLAYTNTFTNAVWVISNTTDITVSATDSGSSSPDGTSTVTSLTSAAINSTITQGYVTSAAVYTVSVWLKRKTGTGTINLRANTSDSYTAVTLTSSWRRFSVTSSSAANPLLDLQITTSGDAVYIWGPQLEAFSYPTSFAPNATTITSPTRTADVLSYKNASNRTASEESIFVKYIPYAAGSAFAVSVFFSDTQTKRRIFAISSTTDKVRFLPNSDDNIAVVVNGSSAVTAFTSSVAGAIAQHSSPYANITKDGLSEDTYTSGDYTTNNWGTSFFIGSDALSTNQLNGVIQRVAIWPRPLNSSDALAAANVLNDLAVPPVGPPAPHVPTNYYVDFTGGNDSNLGTDTSIAWKTITKINNTTLYPGDVVYFKKGETWSGETLTIRNSGTSLLPITIDAYGTGANPIFSGSAVYGGAWTLYDSGTAWATAQSYSTGAVVSQGGNIYVCIVAHTSGTFATDLAADKWRLSTLYRASNQTQSWTGMVSVDDNSVLFRKTSISNAAKKYGTFFHSTSNDFVYVNLWDGTDPTGHTMRIGQTPTTEFSAIVNIGTTSIDAQYVTVKNIDIKFSNAWSFITGSQHTTFQGCNASYSGKEGFYFARNAFPGADYGLCRNCTVQYATSASTGKGQSITVESSYTWLIDTTVHHGGMAGIDFLDYNTSTNVSYSGCIRCTSYLNGQSNEPADANIYVDGGNHILIYGCVMYGAGVGTDNTTANPGVNLGCEHPETGQVVTDIYFVNNLVYGNASVALTLSQDPGYFIDNIYILNNTFHRVGGSRAVNLFYTQPTGVVFKNNVVYGGSLSQYLISLGTGSYQANVAASDYNSLYRSSGTTIFSFDGAADYTLAQWQAAFPALDIHSSSADNKLVNVTDASFDGHLQSGSSALETGNYNATWNALPQWAKDKLAEEGITGISGWVQSGASVENSGTNWSMGYHYPTSA